MRYPTLTANDVRQFSSDVTLDQSRADRTSAMAFCEARSNHPRSPGSDSDAQLDLTKLDELAKAISMHLSNPSVQDATPAQREAYESELCGKLHESLSHTPYEILDDSRFWNYLSVRYFSEFIVWREYEALAEGNIETYFAASVESIPLRLYLRANVVVESTGVYDLAAQIPEATDFWRSHVLRVRTGRARILAGAVAAMHLSNRMPTKLLRRFAPFVNRMWSNVILSEYDESESAKLLKELRQRAESDEP